MGTHTPRQLRKEERTLGASYNLPRFGRLADAEKARPAPEDTEEKDEGDLPFERPGNELVTSEQKAERAPRTHSFPKKKRCHGKKVEV